MRNSSAPWTRRRWTKEEDEKLLQEVGVQSRFGGVCSWKAISKSIPGRTNKDCRKRWHKIQTSITKGPWDESEDDRLRKAVGKHGFRWIEVSRDVGSRNSDQCAKRWHYAVNPSIDRSPWKPREDEVLMLAVSSHGPSWRLISDQYFPNRATTDIKNRHIIITGRRRKSPLVPLTPPFRQQFHDAETPNTPNTIEDLEYPYFDGRLSSTPSSIGSLSTPQPWQPTQISEDTWMQSTDATQSPPPYDIMHRLGSVARSYGPGVGWLDPYLDELMKSPFELGQLPEELPSPMTQPFSYQ